MASRDIQGMNDIYTRMFICSISEAVFINYKHDSNNGYTYLFFVTQETEVGTEQEFHDKWNMALSL